MSNRELINTSVPCLDHGFVRLVDFMGSDSRVLEAARVSYAPGTTAEQQTAEKSDEENKGLIDYLLRNGHTSPFEQVVFTFHMKMPIFVARQIVRHRMARLNEISGRYTVLKSEFFLPEELRVPAKNNKQGSVEGFDPVAGLDLLESMAEFQQGAADSYAAYLDAGVAKELARINLPLATYTEWYWQMDLSNLIKFMGLRSDAHAQKEVRVYSEAIEWFVSQITPWAYAAYENHIKYGVKLSRTEVEVIRKLLQVSGAVAGTNWSLDEQFNSILLDEKQAARAKRILLEKFKLPV
jgi:thymidylate synthase (FAD)